MKLHLKYFLLCTAIFLSLIRCKKETGSSNINQDSSVFQDNYGRTMIFHGASLYTNDEPGGYRRYNSNSAQRLINDWGLNSVRLFWNWNAIEPDSAVFDPAKLDSIVGVIETFTNEGIYVVLAVNGTATSSQDLVTHTWQAPGTEHASNAFGALDWRVQESMRRFWDYNNKRWSYLQDELINASIYLARRLKNNPYVLGYDMMNEPWGESQISTVLNIGFEDNLLPEFYERYITRMREVEPDKYIFFEPSVLFNSEITSNFITKLPVIRNVRPGVKRLVFAPHNYLYDGKMNTILHNYDSYLSNLKNKYQYILKKQQVPLYLGEWSNIDPANFQDWENYLVKHCAVFDELMISWSYFGYFPVTPDDMSDIPTLNTVSRVYPQATAGKLTSFSYDPDTQIFKMEFISNSSISQPTEIIIPRRHYPAGYNLSVSGTSQYTEEYDASRQVLKLMVKENATVSIEITPK